MSDEHKITSPLAPVGLPNRLFYRFQRILAWPLLKLVCRFTVRGEFPSSPGPLIVAANHESLMDPVVLQVAAKRRFHFLMTSDYYFKPLLNRYSRIMRCIPILEGRFNREAIRSALEVLNAGRPIAIFPQGELRDSGDLESGMRGIALLIIKSGAPVLPARIEGTGKALPRGGWFLRPAPVAVHFGQPLSFGREKNEGSPSRHALLQEITSTVMSSIADC